MLQAILQGKEVDLDNPACYLEYLQKAKEVNNKVGSSNKELLFNLVKKLESGELDCFTSEGRKWLTITNTEIDDNFSEEIKICRVDIDKKMGVVDFKAISELKQIGEE
jgi:hypothetical protein